MQVTRAYTIRHLKRNQALVVAPIFRIGVNLTFLGSNWTPICPIGPQMRKRITKCDSLKRCLKTIFASIDGLKSAKRVSDAVNPRFKIIIFAPEGPIGPLHAAHSACILCDPLSGQWQENPGESANTRHLHRRLTEDPNERAIRGRMEYHSGQTSMMPLLVPTIPRVCPPLRRPTVL